MPLDLTRHHNDELYRTYFENSADMILVFDEDLTLVDANQAACDRYGYSRVELIGKKSFILNAPETLHQSAEILERLRETGGVRGETVNMTKDGRRVPVEVNSRLIDVGGHQHILTIARDISDRKVIENQLRQSQQHFRLLFENTGTANSFYDLHGRLVLCNQFGCRLLGYEDDRLLVGKSFQEIFGEEQGEQFRQRLNRAVADRKAQIHVTEIFVEGKDNWVQTSYIPLIAEDGQVVGVQIVSQDISEQKRYETYLNTAKTALEAQVRERTQHLEAALKQLQEAQNSIVENEKLAVLGRLSASVAHEVNTPLAAIQSANGTIQSSLDAVLTNLPRIFSALSETSREQVLELLRQSEASLRGTIATGPRSMKRQLEATLAERRVPDVESTADALLQLGIAALDPLWLPVLFLDRRAEILDAATQISSLYRSTHIIGTATTKATEFIRALRRFAYKDDHGTPEWFDLVGNVETVLLLLKSQIPSHVELVRAYEARPQALGFPNQLLQVWSNLIQNAMQAMEDRGTLTVGIRTAGNQIVVEITDTGKGIPEELKQKIFEPFFTTKNVDKGTGLGLGIVTDALTQNRGRLEFESQPGKTTFRAILPLDRSQT